MISRYEMGAVGTNLQSTWRDYTGGDTTYAVAITGTAVYVGGHFRWMNNAFAADTAGHGRRPARGHRRAGPEQRAALLLEPGPRAWRRGLRHPRDVDRDLDRRRHRPGRERAAPAPRLLPAASGTTPPPNITGTLPTDVYALGGSDPSVLYRVNAGGPELPSADDGPNWLADTARARHRCTPPAAPRRPTRPM